MRFLLAPAFAIAALLLTACGSDDSVAVVDDAAASSSSVSSVMMIAESSSSSSVEAFDPSSIGAYSDHCTKVEVAASTTVRYEDKDSGFSIDLPFNDAWGSAPYMKDDDGLHFGPPVSYESPDGGCAREAAFTLQLLPKRGAEDARQAHLNDYSAGRKNAPPEGWGVNLVMVDRRAAVQWGIGDWICPMPALEIPGTKVNLQLNVACHYPKPPLDAEDDLEGIMQGIEFSGDGVIDK
jgi:hypothetical protein